MSLPVCDTNADVLHLIKTSGRPYRVLATTLNDLPLYVIETGGEKTPPILITAGVHAGEPSGVYAALALAHCLRSDHKVYIIPARDPFAWEGYTRALSYALGQNITLPNHQAAEDLLTRGGEVICREGSLIVSQVGDLVFACMRPRTDTTGPQEIWRRLRIISKTVPGLADRLSGQRIILPTNLPQIEGCGAFDRAYTVVGRPDGRIHSLHDIYDMADPPIEVAAVRRLVDEIKPGLFLDLHEGQLDQFYLFAASLGSDLAENIAKAMFGAVTQRGYHISTRQELETRNGPEVMATYMDPIPGVFVRKETLAPSGPPFTLDEYCWQYGPAFLLETGRWHYAGLKRRVALHLWAAQAAVDAFAFDHALTHWSWS